MHIIKGNRTTNNTMPTMTHELIIQPSHTKSTSIGGPKTLEQILQFYENGSKHNCKSKTF